MKPLFHLLYRSEVPEGLSYSDLDGIIEKGRLNNRDSEITSILIQKDDYFIQLLEGDEQKVKFLLSDILMDSHTKSLKVIYEGPTLERVFEGLPLIFLDGDMSVNSSDPLEQLFELCMDAGKIETQKLFTILDGLKSVILEREKND